MRSSLAAILLAIMSHGIAQQRDVAESFRYCANPKVTEWSISATLKDGAPATSVKLTITAEGLDNDRFDSLRFRISGAVALAPSQFILTSGQAYPNGSRLKSRARFSGRDLLVYLSEDPFTFQEQPSLYFTYLPFRIVQGESPPIKLLRARKNNALEMAALSIACKEDAPIVPTTTRIVTGLSNANIVANADAVELIRHLNPGLRGLDSVKSDSPIKFPESKRLPRPQRKLERREYKRSIQHSKRQDSLYQERSRLFNDNVRQFTTVRQRDTLTAELLTELNGAADACNAIKNRMRKVGQLTTRMLNKDIRILNTALRQAMAERSSSDSLNQLMFALAFEIRTMAERISGRKRSDSDQGHSAFLRSGIYNMYASLSRGYSDYQLPLEGDLEDDEEPYDDLPWYVDAWNFITGRGPKNNGEVRLKVIVWYCSQEGFVTAQDQCVCRPNNFGSRECTLGDSLNRRSDCVGYAEGKNYDVRYRGVALTIPESCDNQASTATTTIPLADFIFYLKKNGRDEYFDMDEAVSCESFVPLTGSRRKKLYMKALRVR